LASGLGIGALAGCLNPPDPEGDSSADINGEQDATERENEQETIAEAGSLHFSFQTVSEFTQWKTTEYESAVSSYRDGLRTIEAKLEELSERDGNTITQSDLDTIFEMADDAASVDEGFDEYYGTTPGLSTLADDLQTDLQRNLDRSEYEQLSLDMARYRNTYRALSTATEVSRRFPSDPVFGMPYERFIAAEDPEEYNDYIFEAMVVDNSDEIKDAFFVTYDEVDISEDPFNHNPNGITASNRHIPVNEFIGDIVDRSTHDIVTESRINIIQQSLYEEYPDEYFDTGDTVSVSDSEAVGVVIYELEDTAAAEELYDTYIETGTVDSQFEFGDYSWDRVFFDAESPTVYLHLRSHQEYVVCMDVTDTQWERRSFGDDEASLGDVLEGTFLDID